MANTELIWTAVYVAGVFLAFFIINLIDDDFNEDGGFIVVASFVWPVTLAVTPIVFIFVGILTGAKKCREYIASKKKAPYVHTGYSSGGITGTIFKEGK